MNCNLKGVSKTRQAFLRKLVSYCPFQSYLKERPDSSTVDMYIPNEKSLRLEVYIYHKTASMFVRVLPGYIGSNDRP